MLLQADLSAGEDRLAAAAEQLSEFQAIAAAQEAKVRALRSELSARREAAAVLHAHLGFRVQGSPLGFRVDEQELRVDALSAELSASEDTVTSLLTLSPEP